MLVGANIADVSNIMVASPPVPGNREVGRMKFTDIVSPFLAWSRAARRVDTIPYPKRRNPGSDRYRFHINDTDKCIGCGRCEVICENLAIDMVKQN